MIATQTPPPDFPNPGPAKNIAWILICMKHNGWILNKPLKRFIRFSVCPLRLAHRSGPFFSF